MVVSWSPEPSKSKEEWLPRNSNHIVTFDDDSEDDGLFPFFGYELLPHDISNEFTPEIEMESESDSDNSETREVVQREDLEQDVHNKSVSSADIVRQDIVINLEEVREAMSNVTLPESAIPPWAAQIPESQWTSFLLSRIRNMQNPNQTA